tara:strand:- start:107 stop:706 length:600 start_codon:yes stop_codon:yes gene_type:complete
MFFHRWPYLILLLLLTFLSACATPVVSDYKALTSNTDQLSSLGGGAVQKIAVDDFTITTSRVDMSCRVFGEINLKEGVSVEEYIRNALISELESANLYSATSQKRLGVNIDYVNLVTTTAASYVTATFDSLTDSKWSITATFKGKGENNFTIPSIYLFPFRDSFFDGPCENPRKKFDGAVANLIKILVNHPSFTEFLAK